MKQRIHGYLLNFVAAVGLLVLLVGCATVPRTDSSEAARPQSPRMAMAPGGGPGPAVLGEACGRGEGAMCNELAILWYYGFDGSADQVRAREYFARACELLNNDGCFNLSSMWAAGLGGPRDRSTALDFAQRACELRDGFACLTARSLDVSEGVEGDGVTARGNGVDPAEGSRQAVAKNVAALRAVGSRACDEGDAESCFQSGSILARGEDGSRDATAARQSYAQACALGHAKGCELLSAMWYTGDGGPKSKVAWQQLGLRSKTLKCKAGDAEVCFSIAYSLDTGADGVTDRALAREYYGSACDAGIPEACNNLGLMWEDGEGGAADPAKARGLYGAACEAGSTAGCANAAVLWDRGEGGERDRAKARRLWGRACDGGDGGGCNSFGWRLFGEGDSGARAAFEHACYPSDSRDPHGLACFNLGSMALLVDVDAPSAVEHFERGCRSGEAGSCIQQAVLLAASRPADAAGIVNEVERDAISACAHDGETCLALADWYERTGDSARDRSFREKGRQLLDTACTAGDSGSCRILRLR